MTVASVAEKLVNEVNRRVGTEKPPLRFTTRWADPPGKLRPWIAVVGQTDHEVVQTLHVRQRAGLIP